DMDALPDDPAELKKLLAQERERQAVKDAIIEVLMGGSEHTQGSGDASGKALVRDGALSIAAKAAVVCALTDTHHISIAKACALAADRAVNVLSPPGQTPTQCGKTQGTPRQVQSTHPPGSR
ncbi:hypothetical protein, partial [Corynebacterium sp. NML 120412]|uniref:hypothetical protein n=1 Tax=Corynebacterium sp. NML 120412 TaxID=2029401 RepID=UPI001303F6F4